MPQGFQSVHSDKVQLIKNAVSSTGNARRIVIAVNETPESIHGLKWTLEHIVDCKKDLVLIVNVTSTLPKNRHELRRVSGFASLEELGLVHLDDTPVFSDVSKLVRAFDCDNGSQLECIYCTLFNGDVGAGIIEFCNEMGANLLTIGKRELGTMQKLVAASISTRMMNQASWYLFLIIVRFLLLARMTRLKLQQNPIKFLAFQKNSYNIMFESCLIYTCA